MYTDFSDPGKGSSLVDQSRGLYWYKERQSSVIGWSSEVRIIIRHSASSLCILNMSEAGWFPGLFILSQSFQAPQSKYTKISNTLCFFPPSIPISYMSVHFSYSMHPFSSTEFHNLIQWYILILAHFLSTVWNKDRLLLLTLTLKLQDVVCCCGNRYSIHTS